MPILPKKTKNMRLNEYQTNLLRNYQQIISYGNQKMAIVKLERNKVRLKKQILYFMMCAAQSYSESILRLVSPPRIYDKSAEVLMRSLVELFINLNYINSGKGQKNALIFIADSINERIDFANKYQKFMRKYPNWNIPFGSITKPDDWDKFIQEKQKEIVAGEKHFKIKLPKKLPDIRGRAIIFDDNLKSRNKLSRKKSLEYYYIAYYKYFSQIAHLTMPGLERFLTESEKGMLLNLDGKPEDLDRVVAVSYQFYFVMLRFFLKQFKAYDNQEFAQFEDFSKNMVKTKTSS